VASLAISFFEIFWARIASSTWLRMVVAVVWRRWRRSMIVRMVGMRLVLVHMLHHRGVAAADG
jgi:hypothetical protein